MSSIELLILLAIVAFGLIIFRMVWSGRTAGDGDQRIRKRQLEIQSLLDNLGETLKVGSTTLQDGETAASIALRQLHQLNHDGSLTDLIADTEIFVQGWRVKNRPA